MLALGLLQLYQSMKRDTWFYHIKIMLISGTCILSFRSNYFVTSWVWLPLTDSESAEHKLWLSVHGFLLCFNYSNLEGNGSPLQCSCLENPRGDGAWWAVVCGVAQSQTRLKQLSSSSSSIILIITIGSDNCMSLKTVNIGLCCIMQIIRSFLESFNPY